MPKSNAALWFLNIISDFMVDFEIDSPINTEDNQ